MGARRSGGARVHGLACLGELCVGSGRRWWRFPRKTRQTAPRCRYVVVKLVAERNLHVVFQKAHAAGGGKDRKHKPVSCSSLLDFCKSTSSQIHVRGHLPTADGERAYKKTRKNGRPCLWSCAPLQVIGCALRKSGAFTYRGIPLQSSTDREDPGRGKQVRSR